MSLENRTPPVPIGMGFYHTPKVKYSEETKKLLKDLMEESKVANQYRRVVNKILDKGGQLPIPNAIGTHSPLSSPLPIPPILTMPKRRSREIIVQSGVYEPERAPPGPTNPLTAKNNYLYHREREKERLSSMMAYGKEIPSTPRRLWQKGAKACRASNFISATTNEHSLNSRERLKVEMTDRIRFLNDVNLYKKEDKQIRTAAQQVAQELSSQIKEFKQINQKEGEQIANEIGPILKNYGVHF